VTLASPRLNILFACSVSYLIPFLSFPSFSLSLFECFYRLRSSDPFLFPFSILGSVTLASSRLNILSICTYSLLIQDLFSPSISLSFFESFRRLRSSDPSLFLFSILIFLSSLYLSPDFSSIRSVPSLRPSVSIRASSLFLSHLFSYLRSVISRVSAPLSVSFCFSQSPCPDSLSLLLFLLIFVSLFEY
jgi:hypothetical protein